MANTGGPGIVGRSWKTPCYEVEAKQPLEERTSGYSKRSFLISHGAVWRCAQNGFKAEGEETAERTSR